MLSLIEDKVITVRMTLARVLISKPQIARDPEIQQALQKLMKDRCGDIRDLVANAYQDLLKEPGETGNSYSTQSDL